MAWLPGEEAGMNMDVEGTIRREGAKVIVEAPGDPSLEGMPGIICFNANEPSEDRYYQKLFVRKQIWLPNEYAQAIAANVAHPDNFVISMNGYSSIKPDQCRRYGMQPGAYEEACAAILRNALKHLLGKFHAQLRLIYGASDMGVDAAIERVAREFNLYPLGFSCPRFMLYVKDDDMPVYVAESRDAYADRFIKSLDLLIATGGREHALRHDILASCLYNKRIHFVDVLNILSDTGGVPAVAIDAEGNFRVENAAAAMGRNVSFFDRDSALRLAPSTGDRWDAVFADVASVATDVCRRKMSPARKFA